MFQQFYHMVYDVNWHKFEYTSYSDSFVSGMQKLNCKIQMSLKIRNDLQLNSVVLARLVVLNRFLLKFYKFTKRLLFINNRVTNKECLKFVYK